MLNIKTNAEYIRSMTNEELARELTRNPSIPCRMCEFYDKRLCNCGADNGFLCVVEYAEALTLDWLQSPYDNIES